MKIHTSTVTIILNFSVSVVFPEVPGNQQLPSVSLSSDSSAAMIMNHTFCIYLNDWLGLFSHECTCPIVLLGSSEENGVICSAVMTRLHFCLYFLALLDLVYHHHCEIRWNNCPSMTGKHASPWKLLYTYENGASSEFILLCKPCMRTCCITNLVGMGAICSALCLSNTVGSCSGAETPNVATMRVLLLL